MLLASPLKALHSFHGHSYSMNVSELKEQA